MSGPKTELGIEHIHRAYHMEQSVFALEVSVECIQFRRYVINPRSSSHASLDNPSCTSFLVERNVFIFGSKSTKLCSTVPRGPMDVSMENCISVTGVTLIHQCLEYVMLKSFISNPVDPWHHVWKIWYLPNQGLLVSNTWWVIKSINSGSLQHSATNPKHTPHIAGAHRWLLPV